MFVTLRDICRLILGSILNKYSYTDRSLAHMVLNRCPLSPQIQSYGLKSTKSKTLVASIVNPNISDDAFSSTPNFGKNLNANDRWSRLSRKTYSAHILIQKQHSCPYEEKDTRENNFYAMASDENDT